GEKRRRSRGDRRRRRLLRDRRRIADYGDRRRAAVGGTSALAGHANPEIRRLARRDVEARERAPSDRTERRRRIADVPLKRESGAGGADRELGRRTGVDRDVPRLLR